MQEKSLESTEIFKIFRGSIPPYPLVSRAFSARYFALNILCLRTPFNENQLRAWAQSESVVQTTVRSCVRDPYGPDFTFYLD